MKILIVGAGATGGYFGALLTRAGRDVTFLVHPHRAEVLRTRGLRIVATGDAWAVQPQLVTADQLTETFDLVVLSVKATALRSAIDDLAPAVGPQTMIVPFLNGIGHLDALQARFGPSTVMGGVVKVATQLNEEGDIVQVAPGASLLFGALDGPDTSGAQAAHAALDGAGFDVGISDNIMAGMWHKWVFIATLGALTCLMRSSVGDIAAEPGGRDLATGILAEAAAVASAAGYQLPPVELGTTATMITETGSPLTSSMFRDLATQRHTEVEHILGDLTFRARNLAVPTPLLDSAVLHLRVYERRLAAWERQQADRP
ncbi:MAG TPA: ketopantoate reductase family protein [Candidatus Lustribacter sp.]|nr:ketopantoate reductase family protein [Candidatus Lustribacter sp.]